MTPRLRLADHGDLAAIREVVRTAYEGYVARIGREPGPMGDDYGALIAAGRVHVAARDSTVLGILVLIPQDDAMLLDNVAVAPAAQGLGLGRDLLAFAERTAIDAGYDALTLYTNVAMTENIALYHGLGFAETHRAEVEGLRRIYMRKALAAA